MIAVSFLTPLDSLFVLAAAVPLAALVAMQRRAVRIRRALRVRSPGRRAALPVAVALVALPALVGVAAAQPVVVHEQLVSERADAEAYFVFDTSLSMTAASAPGRLDRLGRAKRLALRLRATLSDVPVGIATMTDRVLPDLLPTTDATLFTRTLDQSVAIDRPPPSEKYKGRATNFDALIPIDGSRFYTQGVSRRLLVVFTDGEAQKISPILGLTLHRTVTPVFVHVWSADERIYHAGKPVPGYVPDPTSAAALDEVASLTNGKAFDEGQLGAIERAARAAVGRAATRTQVDAYARVALAPWFLLGGVVPLGFLLWRRNL